MIIDLMISIVSVIYRVEKSEGLLKWSIIIIIIGVIGWGKELIEEGTYKGEQTKIENESIEIGFILFVISEIVVFIMLFFTYLYNSIIPSVEIGCEYPPIGIEILNSYSIPILNSGLLYFSGITFSVSQNKLIGERDKKGALKYIVITIILAIIFTTIQGYEYYESKYTITDSIYGSNFYILTGFHGVHVIIGTSLLIKSMIRLYQDNYMSSKTSQVGYRASGIYWAFVDYAWLYIMAVVYIWGS